MKPAVAILLGPIPAALYAAAAHSSASATPASLASFSCSLLGNSFGKLKPPTGKQVEPPRPTFPFTSCAINKPLALHPRECLQMIESGQLQPTDWAYLEGDDE